ncbi:hypothetical protein DFH08DRAFT_970826 [Mycena albidolilacea]|uniref:Uncharacterized protein n=1 Tax=Mycena albidolilacea TaxID=1033008 RepID=A0AAD6ZEW4_9AGAR|nr:hypothetical protein DFH08DRAFT_970826 [Mycena albidolilacea]
MACLGKKQILAVAPGVAAAKDVLMDIQLFLQGPSRDANHGGYIPPPTPVPGFASEWKEYTAIFPMAIAIGRDKHCARTFASLSQVYITDRKVLPINLYGHWTKSMLADEDLATDIRNHLQELSKFITAEKLIQYLTHDDIQDRKKGQYCNGHEHKDVVYYREEVYLPTLKGFQDRSWIFEADGTIITPSLLSGTRCTVIWYQDESIFYAHDHRQKSWYHKDADSVPYKKGDGHLYMVTDYFSAHYGWLCFSDGQPTTCRAMCPGKKHNSYFSSEDIEEQAVATCTLRSTGALSARAMQKSISGTQKGKNVKPEANFPILVNKLNKDGSQSYDAHSNLLKENIQMTGASFADGTPQDLYFPLNAPKHTSKFKGMAIILEEHRKRGDLGPVSETVLKKKNAECPKFKCSDPNSGTCCMCCMLFNQPDFTVVKSCLEVTCTEFHVTVLFLPKFHCELNPIEIVWGYMKRLYRLNPESS